MRRFTEIIRVRLTADELNYIKKCMKEEGSGKFQNGKENLSAYVRQRLMANMGYRNTILEKQNENLAYEIRKIGVNINQIARKLNAGFGSRQDITDLFFCLNLIQQTLDAYQKKVNMLWESRN